MKPPIKELEKVISFYKNQEKKYNIKMDVTIPVLNHILKELKLYKKYKCLIKLNKNE